MIKSHLKIGNGPILNMDDSHGLVYISSDSILSAPLKSFEETSYPEQEGANINPKTVEDAFDYTVKFYVRADGSLGNANKIITDFNKKLTNQYGTIDLGDLTYKKGVGVNGTIHSDCFIEQDGTISVGLGTVGEFSAEKFPDGFFSIKSENGSLADSYILISCVDDNGVYISDEDIETLNYSWREGHEVNEVLAIPQGTKKIYICLDDENTVIRACPYCFEANFDSAESPKDDDTVPSITAQGFYSMSYNDFVESLVAPEPYMIAYKGDSLVLYGDEYTEQSVEDFKDAVEGKSMTYVVRQVIGGTKTYNQVTFYNDYKRVKIVGYPNQISEATDFWRDSKNNTHDIVLVEWKIRVNKPSLCDFNWHDETIEGI